ncbi:MAG TPA: PVC-type heme-binding CxxCH protein [Methylomirabilota bacterium]|nr:PVC-type heme-binding CxxCH protein [Methylomirabilota bacterium]
MIEKLLRKTAAISAVGVLLPALYAQHGDPAARAAVGGLEPAPGLRVELFASDPLLFNPVAFSIDEQGRFFIAESHRWKDSIFDLWSKDDRWKLADFSFTNVSQREAFLRAEFATNLTLLTKDSEIIRLVEDKDGNGIADSSVVFADGFNQVVSGTAAGVLASGGQLWFTCIPDLVHFTYSASGQANTRETLHTGYGVRTSVSGHDLHGLVRGFDGRIYFSVGDRGANVQTREGKQLNSVNSGAVFRCEPDGSNLEIFATGLRNPQDLAFDLFGNLWTHDNDTSGDDSPRVLHIIEGGDYGWRQAYQFMDGFGPWVKEKVWEGKLDDVLPSAGAGAQGPSGLATYPGTGLPEKYRGALLACDFPQGVWAYFPHPKGATYEIRKERFLWALGPTDVDFGPDGHTYISDWGRSYAMPNSGRLLKIIAPEIAPSTNLAQLLRTQLGSGQSAELSRRLAHPDLRVRLAAQFHLQERGATPDLITVATTSTNQLARIHAIWGLGNPARLRKIDISPTLLELTRSDDAEIRAQAAAQLGEVNFANNAATRLEELLKDSSPRVQLQAALALARTPLKSQATIPALLNLAARQADQEPFLRHAVVLALARTGDEALLAKAAGDTNPHIRRVAGLALRRLQSSRIANLLSDPDSSVRRDAARAINDAEIEAAIPALADRLTTDETDPQILLRAINANFRLGDAPHWDRVLQFARNANAAEALRVEALDALADWAKPSPLDRVVGIWRPINTKRQGGSQERLAQTIDQLLQSPSTNLVSAALSCAEQTTLIPSAPGILKLLQTTSYPSALRAQALRVLGNINSDLLGAAVDEAYKDTNPALRAEAITWVAKVAPERALAVIAAALANERDIRIQQNAILALGTIQAPAARAFLQRLGTDLLSGTSRTHLHVEIVEALTASKQTNLLAQLHRKHKDAAKTDPLAPFLASLSGGDAQAGKRVFTEKDAVGCLRCHAIKGQGGIVGPDLAGIASKRDRRHLLQSIVHPNAEFSPGYESVSLALKDGRSLAGSVQAETETELTLNSGEDGIIKVSKADIARREANLSPMPEALPELMTPRELRDLVEYLTTLK